MAVSRRNFLLFGAQLNPYAEPKKGVVADVRFADEIAGEKKRPPVPVGAGSWNAFRTKCVGCLKCVPACPRGLIVPSSKLGHLGRPEIRFVKGWCRPECNRCGAACPAGAIRTDKNVRSSGPNLAIWHPERCVAATGKDECHACERHCPVKAITLVDAATGETPVAPAGTPFKVPRVDPAKCIGCGACEHYCPARPKAAMSVEGRV